MLETCLAPKEQREMRHHILRRCGVVHPRCWFCDKILAVGFFCFGCGEFVCEDCNNHEACGEHSVEEHCKSEADKA